LHHQTGKQRMILRSQLRQSRLTMRPIAQLLPILSNFKASIRIPCACDENRVRVTKLTEKASHFSLREFFLGEMRKHDTFLDDHFWCKSLVFLHHDYRSNKWSFLLQLLPLLELKAFETSFSSSGIAICWGHRSVHFLHSLHNVASARLPVRPPSSIIE